ncbi:MAG: pyridoxal kinase PdxY [Alphaproteobacteria bacterium]|nr:pyridoxal kinase PdxY [Alphaproteobacteria bacterium]
MPILSIQSSVVYGHVGNSVAALPLMRLGHEVWRLDTVAFSNHPGHGSFSGRVVPPSEVAELLRGLKALGVLKDCRAVLSGYLGEAGTAAVVAEAVFSAKSANPKAIYLLDPVIGDGGRVFVRPGVPEAIAERLVPLADICTPNVFELDQLTGMKVTDLDSARVAAHALRRRGPRTVIVTGLPENGRISTLAVTNQGMWRVTAPRVDRPLNGTGDLIAALILGHYLDSSSISEALGLAASGMAEAIEATVAADRRELALVPALGRIVHPPNPIKVEKID